MTTTTPARRAASGFTLVELVIVIGIMGILVTLLAPTLGKALEIVRKNQTRSIIQQIGVGLDAFYGDFKAHPPTDDTRGGQTYYGAANLVYYLSGPAGHGWGTHAGGAMPFGGGRATRAYGPYYLAEEDQIVRDASGVAHGFLDAFEPAGIIGTRYVGRILYFRLADDGSVDGTPGDWDEDKMMQNFASDNALISALTRTESVYSTGGGGTQDRTVFSGKRYALVSPGPDRRYGYVKKNNQGIIVSAQPSDSGAYTDDITNYAGTGAD